MPPQAEQEASGSAPAPAPAPHTSRFVQTGKLNLHYLDYGTPGRPPMLCVHGSAAHAHWFDFVASGFTPDYHVRAIDLRGHGDSAPVEPPSYTYEDYASDLNKAAEALDLRDFVLVGHSMGGAVSLLYAATYPGRLKKLIVVDTSMKLSSARISEMRDVGNRPGRSYDSKEEIVTRFRLRPGHSFATPELIRYIGSHSVKQAADGTWGYKFDRAVYATRESVDWMPLWKNIKIPALLVKGDQTHRITPEVFAEIKATAPQVELAEVSRTDHHITLDNPTHFIEVVTEFLSRR
jgi:pimeloyl-ACP methyl ester carboxylesterase